VKYSRGAKATPYIIYMTRNSIADDLVSSQVISLINRVSHRYTFILITFEKSLPSKVAKDLDPDTLGLLDVGVIEWKPQKFYSAREAYMSVGQFIIITAKLVLLVRLRKISIVHARSYIPAFIAALAKCLCSFNLIFDTRAVWIRELVSDGKITENGPVYRTLSILEKFTVQSSDVIVTLTTTSQPHFKSLLRKNRASPEFHVIPTCVESKAFELSWSENNVKKQPLIYGIVGTVLSSWFDLQSLARLMGFLLEYNPDSVFHFCTRDNADEIMSNIPDELHEKILIQQLPHHKMSHFYKTLSMSIMIFRNSHSKVGSFPTRFAESLIAGLPVIINDVFEDVSQLMRSKELGILLSGDVEGLHGELNVALDRVINDRDISQRCRSTARENLSMDRAVDTYQEIYSSFF